MNNSDQYKAFRLDGCSFAQGHPLTHCLNKQSVWRHTDTLADTHTHAQTYTHASNGSGCKWAAVLLTKNCKSFLLRPSLLSSPPSIFFPSLPSFISFVCILPCVCVYVCMMGQSKQKMGRRQVLSVSNTACCCHDYFLKDRKRRKYLDGEWEEKVKAGRQRERQTVDAPAVCHIHSRSD